MRISGIQNFITNNINKVNQNSSNSVNNSTKNNLERSPMQDTVSFGRYDKENYTFVSKCVTRKLYKIGELGTELPLRESDYLKVVPAKDTLLDPWRGKCALEFNIDYLKEVRPFASETDVDRFSSRMQEHLDDFNADHRYEAGWEKELDEPEDFVRAIEFAEYLERHPYFSGDSGSSFHREDVDVLNFYDRGLSL